MHEDDQVEPNVNDWTRRLALKLGPYEDAKAILLAFARREDEDGRPLQAQALRAVVEVLHAARDAQIVLRREEERARCGLSSYASLLAAVVEAVGDKG